MEAEKSLWQQMNDELWKPLEAAYDILKRGYRICAVDGKKDILIVGINPSYPKDEPGNSTYPLPNANETGHWEKMKSMLYNNNPKLDLYDKAAYVDIFGCRESDQKEIMKKIIRNPYLQPYVIAQVKATQKIIEDVIQPKIIITMFQSVWAFFGNNQRLTWMGYEFEPIPDEKFDIRRITGFSNREGRINQSEYQNTNLKGSIVVFAKSPHNTKYKNYKEYNKYYPDSQKINSWLQWLDEQK